MLHFLGLRYFRLPRSDEVTSEAEDIGDGFDAIDFPKPGPRRVNANGLYRFRLLSARVSPHRPALRRSERRLELAPGRAPHRGGDQSRSRHARQREGGGHFLSVVLEDLG
jgi:hypothetical protein